MWSTHSVISDRPVFVSADKKYNKEYERGESTYRKI